MMPDKKVMDYSQINPEKLEDIDFTKILEEAPSSKCSDYASCFKKEVSKSSDNENEQKALIFSFLMDICSLLLSPEDSYPFTPMVEYSNGSRSFLPRDLSDEELEIIYSLTEHIQDVELLSRLNDILWIERKNHKAASEGINAYLETARQLFDNDDEGAAENRIVRAINLAKHLGDSELLEKTGEVLEDLIHDSLEDTPKVSGRLLEAVHENGLEINYHLIQDVENRAEEASDSNELKIAQILWEVVARIHETLGNEEESKKSMVSAAETYVSQAQEATKSMTAVFFYKKAIEAFRRVGNHKDKIEEIRQMMSEKQKDAFEEMEMMSEVIKVEDIRPKVQEHVKEFDFLEAILRLAFITDIPSQKKMENQVENLVEDHPLMYSFRKDILSEDGETVAIRPSIVGSSEKQKERGIRAESYRLASQYREIATKLYITPARRQIFREHQTDSRSLYSLLINNPFIPPDRIYLFARGFSSGFNGDFVEACHILISQLENSLRFLLQKQGVVVSSFDDEGIQEKMALNTMLWEENEELEKILGSDIVFNLRGLLADPLGDNLRNRLAHGLLSSNAFNLPRTEYAWWLILRICLLPLANSMRKEDHEEK